MERMPKIGDVICWETDKNDPNKLIWMVITKPRKRKGPAGAALEYTCRTVDFNFKGTPGLVEKARWDFTQKNLHLYYVLGEL